MTKEVGPVDVLVNNAGITRDMTFKKMTKADWDAVISTNLDSVFNMTKQVMDGMVERKWGRVINVSVGQRPERRLRPDQLLGGQGRHAWLSPRRWRWKSPGGRDGQHHFAGLHRHQDGHGDPAGNPRFKILPQIPVGRLASRKRSPAWWPTCRPTKPRS